MAGANPLHLPSGPRIPRLRTPTRMPQRPKLYQPSKQQPVGGPGDPPPGFLGATNSAYEWMVYWALAKIFGDPTDPRVPPFDGGWPIWTYQKAAQGGRHLPGGSVIDFVVWDAGEGGKPLALRVVTEYFHLYTDNLKHVTDLLQRESLENYATVIDLLDYDFINDPTGQAVILVCKNALGMLEHANPLLNGTAVRGSRLKARW